MELFLILCLGAAVLLILTPLFAKKPWESLLLFGVFILLQDYLLILTSNPILQQGIKNTDEFFIWYFFIVSLLAGKNKKIFLFDYLIAVMLLAGLISSFLNGARAVVMISDIILMFKFYALFRAATLWNFGPEKLETLVRVVFIAALVFVFIGLLEVIAPDPVRGFIWGAGSSKVFLDERFGIVSASGIFIHPGLYGWFMAVASAFAIARFLVLHEKKYLLLFGIFFFGIVLSMRRKPLLGIAAVILIFLILNYKRVGSIRKSTVIGILAAMLCFGFLFQDQLTEIAQSTMEGYFSSENMDTVARDVLYYTGGKIAIDKFPFGAGLGRFGGFISFKYYSDVYYQYGINRVYGLSGDENEASFGVDTFWPYVLGELGIIGLLCFFYLIYKLLHVSLRVVRQEHDVRIKSFSIAVYCIVLESFIEAFAAPTYTNSTIIYFVFLPSALIVQRWTGWGVNESQAQPAVDPVSA